MTCSCAGKGFEFCNCPVPALTGNERAIWIEGMALAYKAELLGLVVEISSEPLQPLAMGNHRAVVNVYTRRNPS
jgi:hypothetical protein